MQHNICSNYLFSHFQVIFSNHQIAEITCKQRDQLMLELEMIHIAKKNKKGKSLMRMIYPIAAELQSVL